MMAKGFKKVYDSFQPFFGPNLHQDIEAVRRNIKAFKHNMLIVKTSIYKTSRIMKIKKHKRNKKNFVKQNFFRIFVKSKISHDNR